jgi:hypothetical protein
VAQDQAEDGVVAEAGLVDAIEAHGGDDLTRGRDVVIDGVEQRPPGGDRGGRDEGGAIQQDGSHVVKSLQYSHRADAGPIRGARCEIPAGSWMRSNRSNFAKSRRKRDLL